MEKKYIRENRYKKASIGSRRKRSENISRKLRDAKGTEEVFKSVEKNVVRKKKNYSKNRNNKFTLLLIMCIVLLLLCILSFVLKGENKSFFNIFGIKVEDESIEKLDIAVVDNVDVLDNNSRNVIFTELNNYSYGVLLRVTDEYEIKYELLENVEKQNNREYVLNISKDNTLTSSVLKSRLNLYSNSDSKYYSNCKMIQSIEEIDAKTVKLKLSEEVPLFIYNLQIPISFSATNAGMYIPNTTRGASNKITYIKKEEIDNSVPKSISLITARNDAEAVELFRNESIDMFFTDSYDIAENFGKDNVDIRSYLNGKCLFLFGNKNSERFSKKEIRQAIAYSIDREKIRKEVYLNSGTIIDIPMIYSDVKYKYDIYDAQNILLTSGYVIKDSKFMKDGKYLSLTLLVNKADETKIKVATYIKDNLEEIGISINLKPMTSTEIERQVELGNYDLVLADISLNENPDISFVEKYINVSEVMDNKIKEMESLDNVETIISKVNELMQTLSDEVVCLGIHADMTYVVCNKGMNVFSDIKYMNVFTNLLLTK